MSVKQKIINVLDFMNEEDAGNVLDFINESFVFRRKTWDDIEEEEPTPEEKAFLDKYFENRDLAMAE